MAILDLLGLIFWICMLVNCIQNRRLSDTQRIIWVLVIIFVPFLGAGLYLSIFNPHPRAPPTPQKQIPINEAEAEGVARPARGIEIARFEDFGVDKAAAAELEPFAGKTGEVGRLFPINKYFGKCHNLTHKLHGDLQLTLTRDSKGGLSGDIVISGELTGGGKTTGTIIGDIVKLTSYDPDTQMTINWQGKERNNDTIAGTYTVHFPPSPEGETAMQAGSWFATLVSYAFLDNPEPKREDAFSKKPLEQAPGHLTKPLQTAPPPSGNPPTDPIRQPSQSELRGIEPTVNKKGLDASVEFHRCLIETTTSMVLFFIGIIAPCMTMTPRMETPLGDIMFWINFFSGEGAPQTVSLLGGILHLLVSGDIFLGGLLILFSLAFPVYKLLMMFSICRHSLDAPDLISLSARANATKLAALGKWSMLDVFVIGLIVISFKTFPGGTSIDLEWGVYFFGASVLLSMHTASKIKHLLTIL